MNDTTRMVLIALGVALLVLALLPLLVMTGMMSAMIGRGMDFAWPIGFLPLPVLIAGIVLVAIGVAAGGSFNAGLPTPFGAKVQSGMAKETVQAETVRVRQRYEAAADRYDRSIGLSEKLLFGDGRAWVCAQARGDVLELAVGTGRNLPYYPEDARLTGIDLSPAMLAIARRRAEQLSRAIDLRIGDAQSLDFPDDRFDTVVATLALCTIPDDRAAVAEAKRVLRPGGRLVLLEHVRSPLRVVRAVQRLLDPLFVRCEGDHLLREPLCHVEAEGFVVEHFERSKWGIVERLAATTPG